MVRAIFGADCHVSGSVTVFGMPFKRRRVYRAIKHNIGLLPEDRKAQGLVMDMSVKENLSLANVKSVMSGWIMSSTKERHLADSYVDKLRIATPDVERKVLYLSGGNQQKVVLAKWLNADSDILLVDEPTRGIDVGAKAEIYKILCSLASQGKAILMVSSELPELLGICDRILVMRAGRLTGNFPIGDATPEKIMECAVG